MNLGGKLPEKICPRCGKPYSYIERRRIKGTNLVYYYAVHMYKEGDKWKKKRCYLGPKVYSNVAPMQGFQLFGLVEEDTERLLEYLDSIISELEDRREELKGKEERILRAIERLKGLTELSESFQ